MAAGRLHEVIGVEENAADLLPSALFARGQAQGPGRPSDEARRELERLCLRAEREGPRSWAQVLPRLKQHVEACPSDTHAWAQLARAYLAQEDRGQALRAAQEALRLSPDVSLGFSVSLLVARSLCEAQRWAAAARLCEAALASHPGEPEALELLVGARFEQDEASLAESALAALAQADAERASAAAQRLAERCRRAEERKRWLLHAASWAKLPMKVLRDLGEVCLVLQQNDEALQCFKRAFAQADGARDADLARALAQLHVRGGRVDEALAVYRAALVAAPDCLPLYRSCWQLLLKEGRTVDAIGVLKQGAAAASPQEAASTYCTLGELQQSLGQTSEAMQSWQAAAERDSACLNAWKGLASAAAATGDEAEQRRALGRLVQLEPEVDEWRARLEALLAALGPAGQAAEEARQHLAQAMAPEPMHQAALQGAGHAAAASDAPAAPALSSRGAAVAGAEGEGWRDGLHEGQEVEVYSKSACRWLASKVSHVAAETVKVKYLVDGQWCEKVLLRSSDSLRLMVDTVHAPSARSPRRAAGGSTASGSPGPAGSPASGSPAVSASGSPQQAPRLGGPSAAAASAAAAAARSPPYAAVPALPGPEAAARPDTQPRQEFRQWSACPGPPAAAAPEAAAPPEEPPARRQWTSTPSAGSQEPAQARAPERRQWMSPAPGGYPEPGARGPASSSTAGAAKAASPRRSGMLATEELVFGQVLGSGGFGSVYRGSYRGQEVAIKKLHPVEGEVSEVQLEEFRKEVANLSSLSNPRLIRFVGAAFAPPNLCIVTEFMPNGSLYGLLHQKKRQLVAEEKLSVSMQITEGVAFLHGLSPPFVHRDLKSLNVVLDFDLGVKLCDFGLTQSMEKTHITRRENECGSPRYMAPELFDSRGKITEKVDVWALGCLVLEVYLGKLPHSDCTSLPQVMDKTLIRREPPFSDRADVDMELWALTELCLEYYPKRRVDAACFLEGLRGLAP